MKLYERKSFIHSRTHTRTHHSFTNLPLKIVSVQRGVAKKKKKRSYPRLLSGHVVFPNGRVTAKVDLTKRERSFHLACDLRLSSCLFLSLCSPRFPAVEVLLRLLRLLFRIPSPVILPAIVYCGSFSERPGLQSLLIAACLLLFSLS